MKNWLGKLGKWLKHSRQRASLDECGITIVTLTQRGAWAHRVEKSLSRWLWTDVARISVQRWDLGVIDTMGMVFTLENGASFIVTEDDMESFFLVAARVLPAAFPAIMPPGRWLEDAYSGKDRLGRPLVIYDAAAATPT